MQKYAAVPYVGITQIRSRVGANSLSARVTRAPRRFSWMIIARFSAKYKSGKGQGLQKTLFYSKIQSEEAMRVGEKDISEKLFEAYNDVFADIVNVLLFGGKRLVNEDELEDAQTVSGYKIDGKLHEQERDVAKYWKDGSVRIAMMGFENQTAIDMMMPLRVIAYDGEGYKAQLVGNIKKKYPVITMVLYFGEKPWDGPTSLKECLDIHPELEPYVSDYKINVFDIGRLSPDTVTKFTSDFKVVADYFVQMNQNKSYDPPKDVIEHVHATIQLMRILTGTQWPEVTMEETEKGAGVTMYDTITKLRSESEARGEVKGIIKTLYNLVRDGVLTLASAAQRANMTEADFLSAAAALR